MEKGLVTKLNDLENDIETRLKTAKREKKQDLCIKLRHQIEGIQMSIDIAQKHIFHGVCD